MSALSKNRTRTFNQDYGNNCDDYRSNDTSSGIGWKRKQQRSSKACICCHDRKVKCDVSNKKDGESCSNCSEAGSSCVIYVRKKRKNQKDQLLELYKKFRPFSNTWASPPNFIKQSLQRELPDLNVIQLDPNVVFKENLASLVRREHSFSNETANYIHDIIDELIAEDRKENRTRAYQLDEMDFQTLSLYGCFNLPDEATCWKYIGNYFRYLNPQLPIIDKNQFYKDYHDLRDPPSLMLLFAVLYVGARHSDTADTNDEERRILTDASEVLFKRAKALFDLSIETEPLPLIQSLLCFMWNYENYSMFSKNDYYWTKIAIQYGQQFGLHRDNDNSSLLTSYEKRMYKRLFWCLFIKDRLIGLGFGRPFMLSLEDCDVKTLNDDDLLDSDLTAEERSYFTSFIGFALLVGNVVTEQAKMNQLVESGKSPLFIIRDCDTLLMNWLATVPYHLKFKIDDPSTQSLLSGILTSQYYTLLTLVHKANIHRGMGQVYPSWAISFQASQMIKLIADSLINKGFAFHVAMITHNTLFAPAIIMLYHLKNEDEQIARISKQFFLKILDVWKHVSIKWPTCRQMWFIFDKLYHSEEKKNALLHSLVRQSKSTNTIIATSNDIVLPQPRFLKSSYTTEGFIAGELGEKGPKFGAFRESRSSKLKSLSTLDIELDRLFTNNVFSESKGLLPKLDLNYIHSSPGEPSIARESEQDDARASSELPISLWLMNASWKPNFLEPDTETTFATACDQLTGLMTDNFIPNNAFPAFGPAESQSYGNHFGSL
ncbi:hypothetical protein KL921_000857 [Ogataea angusta]|nr:hypothetical protein KL921_000857 [Ogataea angusta]